MFNEINVARLNDLQSKRTVGLLREGVSDFLAIPESAVGPAIRLMVLPHGIRGLEKCQ